MQPVKPDQIKIMASADAEPLSMFEDNGISGIVCRDSRGHPRFLQLAPDPVILHTVIRGACMVYEFDEPLLVQPIGQPVLFSQHPRSESGWLLVTPNGAAISCQRGDVDGPVALIALVDGVEIAAEAFLNTGAKAFKHCRLLRRGYDGKLVTVFERKASA